ncbi:MAG: CPBP family intramembrane metalloprotease [Planctomycetes bacterium]|nr:CPBP family intramembrane metalloprotease [Planctomycetota bacterium]
MSDQASLPRSPGDVVMARPVELPPPSSRKVTSPLELPQLERRAAILDLSLVVLALLVGRYALTVAASFGADDFDLLGNQPLLLAGKWLDAAVVAGLATYFLLRHHLPAASFGLRGRDLGQQALWGIGTLVSSYTYILVSLFVIVLVLAVVPGLQQDLAHRSRLIRSLPVDDAAWTVLLLVPVAIHEELLFRGLLVPYLRRVTGRWWLAIPISAVVFGSLHYTQGWLGAVQITGMGVVFGIMFVLSRSLLAVTFAHFAFDLLQFQLARLVKPLLENCPVFD